MKKFTESTGHKEDGVWVDETTQAKLRNKLSPFWTLSELLIILIKLWIVMWVENY